jgi:hypothetical protein
VVHPPELSSYTLAKPSDSELSLGKGSAFIPIQFPKTPKDGMNFLLKRQLCLRQKVFFELLDNIHLIPFISNIGFDELNHNPETFKRDWLFNEARLREPFKTQAPNALQFNLRFSDKTRFMNAPLAGIRSRNELGEPLSL